MTNTSHKNPHYALRIEETTMDKLKYIAGHNGQLVKIFYDKERMEKNIEKTTIKIQ